MDDLRQFCIEIYGKIYYDDIKELEKYSNGEPKGFDPEDREDQKFVLFMLRFLLKKISWEISEEKNLSVENVM